MHLSRLPASLPIETLRASSQAVCVQGEAAEAVSGVLWTTCRAGERRGVLGMRDRRGTLADLNLAQRGPTLATLVRPRSEALFAKRSSVTGKSKRPGLATLIGHVGRLASLAGLVPICTRVHVSRFDPKVPHFSRKDPPVGGAAPGWTWLVMSKN